MVENYVNLYDHFGMERPENGRGNLTCWNFPTSGEISQGRKRPAVLVIPGGAYAFVSDREAEPIALRFMSYGYVPFILRYSCAPLAFPTQLREAAMAMRYIRENAGEYEVDPTMVAAIGFSAGGHLCGTLGTMYDCPEVADIGDASLIRPDALGLCYPVLIGWGNTHEGTMENVSGGDAALRQRLSLDNQVRPDMPPVYLWHTHNDQAVPCRNSLVFAQKLDENGVNFALNLYANGQHGLSLANELVYGTSFVPATSADVVDWTRSCDRFWREMGFRITDK